MISPARRAAFSILLRVESGGWASDLLFEQLAGADPRDAGLATEIVYGSLRRQAQLDYLIRHYSGWSPAALDEPVRIALRIALYQLRFMDRIPAHAAVGESVELVKSSTPRAASLVNAVLRKAGREPVSWPDRETALSMPAWLLDGWDRQYGSDVSEKIAEAFLRPAETWVRNPPPNAGVELEPSDVPGAYRVVSGDPRGLAIQDVGSQSIVPLLDLQKGQTFLDVCAAPGNKTAQALESGVTAVACDLHLHRLRDVPGCNRVVLDAAAGLPLRGHFDRVLVDAPCSGTGTLARNPEIRWRLTPGDLRDLHGRQVRILRNSLEMVGSGGKLVYSTCSLERKENEDVIARVMNKFGEVFVLERTHRRLPGQSPGDGFFAAVLVRT